VYPAFIPSHGFRNPGSNLSIRVSKGRLGNLTTSALYTIMRGARPWITSGNCGSRFPNWEKRFTGAWHMLVNLGPKALSGVISPVAEHVSRRNYGLRRSGYIGLGPVALFCMPLSDQGAATRSRSGDSLILWFCRAGADSLTTAPAGATFARSGAQSLEISGNGASGLRKKSDDSAASSDSGKKRWHPLFDPLGPHPSVCSQALLDRLERILGIPRNLADLGMVCTEHHADQPGMNFRSSIAWARSG
jgi:hypothetical protein